MKAKEDTAIVAVELFKTLGFCHGVLEKSYEETRIFLLDQEEDFPWDKEVWALCHKEYQEEYYQGKEFANGCK